ncbi:hypothetical protein pb186bvf_013223 [Paramecium bursaria]
MFTEKCIKVAITGAAGHIANAFYPLLGSGQVFGEQRFFLYLLEIEAKLHELEGIKMQLEDCAFSLLEGVVITADPKIAFTDIDVAIFLGGIPRSPGMERSDLLALNNEIFQQQGIILNQVAKPTVKCLVVANPSNTNCSTLAAHCPNIPRKNFTSLMQLDHNRCVSQIAKQTNSSMEQIRKVIIWGNHSNTQYPDVTFATMQDKRVKDLFDEQYLRTTLIQQIAKRGTQILQVSKGTSTISGAIAVRDHMKNWVFGTRDDDWCSFGVISDGTHYGIDEGICYSLPVQCKNFEYKVVDNLEIDDFSKKKIENSLLELRREKNEINFMDLLKQ